MSPSCVSSILALQREGAARGVDVAFAFVSGSALITRARNHLVAQFLESSFSHFMFLDADIAFEANDVLTLLALDRDVIGAPCAQKCFRWEVVKEAVLRDPDITSAELQSTATIDMNFVGPPAKFGVRDPVEVEGLGTGLMMIKRNVFERMAKQYPEIAYRPDGSREGVQHAFFDCAIDHRRDIKLVETGETKTVGGTGHYLGEDYTFCQRFRAMGGQVWLCPWMKTKHVGTYAFGSNLPAVAELFGNPATGGIRPVR